MRKVNFLALLGAFLLMNVVNVSAATIVLKEGADLEAGGSLNTAFDLTTSADVVQIAVEDSYHHGNHNSWNLNHGNDGTSSGGEFAIFKYDLSSLGVGAVINTAEFRVRATNGNSGISLAPITTHDWVESNVTGNSPTGNNTTGNRWGLTSDDPYSSADYGPGSAFDSQPAGDKFLVEDVTSIVQAQYAAPATNYGWSVQQGNHGLRLSENANNGQRPALFIDYTPGQVPEPASLLLAGVCLGWVAVARKR